MNQDPARLIMFIALFVGGGISLLILVVLILSVLHGN